MQRVQRVLAALAGDRIDRVPVAFWRYFPGQDDTPEGLAAATVAFWRKFDWDFINLLPRPSYCVEDWAGELAPSRSRSRKTPEPVVKRGSDWAKVRPLTGAVGCFGEQMDALRRVKEAVGGEALILINVYSPISVACQLCGSVPTLMRHMRLYHSEILHALDAIALTLGRFSDACVSAGASGIFFDTTEMATYQLLTDDEYDDVGRTFDLRVLDSARTGLFNVLRVSHSNNMLRNLLDYPVQAFSWDVTERTNASLGEVRKATGRALLGGLDSSEVLATGDKRAIRAQVRGAHEQMACKKWILGSGCAVGDEVSTSTLRYLKKLAEGLKPVHG